MNNQSANINELATALCKCQSEMEAAIKDSLNPHFKSKYADLASVWDAIRVPLTKNGLCVVQSLDMVGENSILISTLMHTSGQWIKSTIPVINAPKTSQGLGSGLSYARRYSLAALVGCVQDDDDGNASMPKEKVEKFDKPSKDKPVPLINKEQFDKLQELADKCDPDYVSKVLEYLAKQGCHGFSVVPQDQYAKVKVGLEKNSQQNEKKENA